MKLNTILRFYYACSLHFGIVWRKLDRVEISKGKWKTLRISWSTAWSVAKVVWLEIEK